MTTRRLTLPTVVLAFGLATLSAAADTGLLAEMQRFGLWYACKPLNLVVEDMSDDGREIGLSRSRIETAVRSRLRAARIYTDQLTWPYGHVHVNVEVAGPTLYASMAMKKWVKDHTSGLSGAAQTWTIAGLGPHGDRPEYILSAVARHTDKFIEEYLRVNADACEKRPSAR